MIKKIKAYVKEVFLGWKTWKVLWLAIACVTIFCSFCLLERYRYGDYIAENGNVRSYYRCTGKSSRLLSQVSLYCR